MQIVAEPRREIKDLAKMILSADDQSLSWFNLGGWYVDCLWMAVLTLPDGDPTLEPILKEPGSRDGITRNLLRMEIAREETAESVGSLPLPLAMLARIAVRQAVAIQISKATQSQVKGNSKSSKTIFKMVVKSCRLLLSVVWVIAKRRFMNLTKKGVAN